MRIRADQMSSDQWGKAFIENKMTHENMVDLLHRIHSALDGKEWCADTNAEVADAMNLFGIPYLAAGDFPECGHSRLLGRGDPASEQVCGDPAAEQVGDHWFCRTHAAEVLRSCAAAERATEEHERRGM